MTDDALRLELLYLFDDLGNDEREVLVGLARRIHQGQETYGELDVDSDRRDWAEEAAQELDDFAIYSEIARLRKRRGWG